MKIAIIGAGNIGGNIARRLAAAGHHISVSFARDEAALQALAAQIGGAAATPAEAAADADVIVLSVPWGAIPTALEQAGSLDSKIVIDTTNQFGPEPRPGGGQTAAAFNAQRMNGARYTKSFNTLTAPFQAEAAQRPEQEKVVQWLCGDDQDAKALVAGLIRDAGYLPVDLGRTADCAVMEAPRRPGARYGEDTACPRRRRSSRPCEPAARSRPPRCTHEGSDLRRHRHDRREVLRQLRTSGVDLRAMTRSAQAAARFRADGIDAVVADLSAPNTLAPALEAIDAVYLANPASPQLPDHEGNLAHAAAAAGVRYLVKLSVIGAAADSPITFGRVHHEAEQAIAAAGIPATMVRPNGFMQNTLAWAAQIPGGVIRGPVMDARWSIVDVRDIAAVAAAALQDPDTHRGASYTVTGPEASSPREQITILSAVLDRPLRAEQVTIEQAQQAMLAAGWPDWSAERMGELFHLYAEGLATDISHDVESVTGRSARDYQQFASDHRQAFASR